MGNKDKNPQDAEAMGERAESTAAKEACNACQASRDLSWERNTALQKQILEAVSRETAKITMHFQALLNERNAVSLPTSLKITSGAARFKVMDPFDWTKDKAT